MSVQDKFRLMQRCRAMSLMPSEADIGTAGSYSYKLVGNQGGTALPFEPFNSFASIRLRLRDNELRARLGSGYLRRERQRVLL